MEVDDAHDVDFAAACRERIAIVGTGCRLPGDVSSTSEFWKLLIQGRSGQCKIPASRFNVDAFYHPSKNRSGSIHTDGGYFLSDDIRSFDNAFFGINNLEATYMDPQQRNLLEVTYECLENAGVTLQQASGANIGCYVGNFTIDFQFIQGKDMEYAHRYTATGMGTTILANRISHAFNLKGPSVVLDTACSSSLYSLHAACNGLKMRECDAAIVAGANLIQSPEQQFGTAKAGVLSSTSTCHTFEASADGYGRAEGIGALYVKRLTDAIRDNDPVYSVIMGTAVNSNGKTDGITLPSPEGQASVIRKAYAQARLPCDQTDYVECHGTGTPVGDPIEIEALSKVMRHRSGGPLLVGSVKTNVGHSEAASAISSIIKVSLALEKGTIPPTVGIKRLNPEAEFHGRHCHVVTEAMKWPEESNTPRASVNSFGYGGANAHVILESASAHVPQQDFHSSTVHRRQKHLLPLSANSDVAVRAIASQLQEMSFTDSDLIDLAYTLTFRRSKLPVRGFLLAEACSPNITKYRVQNLQMRDTRVGSRLLPLCFIFTGQGAQWPGMGFQLIAEYPVVRRTIQDLDWHLQNMQDPPTWTLLNVLAEPEETSNVHSASVAQAVCTAVQIALIDLLRTWGVYPKAVLGHSSGEIAAAYAAGHLTPRAAILTAYYRGLVVSQSLRKGAMMAVGLGEADALAQISSQGLEEHVCVACINSPESTTLSGDCEQIRVILSNLHAQGIFARELRTDEKAYHSHHMRGEVSQMYEEYLQTMFPPKMSDGRTSLGATRMISSSIGGEVSREQTENPLYWKRNLESQVRFAEGVSRLMSETAYTAIEIGPHPVLAVPFKQTCLSTVQAQPSNYFQTLERGKHAVDNILGLVGALFLHGYDEAVEELNTVLTSRNKETKAAVKGQVLKNLPRYPWQYSDSLWRECRASAEFRNRTHPRHELLGSRIPGGSGLTCAWRNLLRVAELPWLSDHKLGDTVVFPAAGYIAMANEAAFQATSCTARSEATTVFRSIKLLKALPLPENHTEIELFTELRPEPLSGASTSGNWWEIYISSYGRNSSDTHFTGLVSINTKASQTLRPSALPLKDGFSEQHPTSSWYQAFANSSLNFGPCFQSMTNILTDRAKPSRKAFANIRLPLQSACHEHARADYEIHPIILDAMLQTANVAGTGGSPRRLKSRIPVAIEFLQIKSLEGFGISQATLKATSEAAGFGSDLIHAELYDCQDRLCAEMRNVRLYDYQGSRPAPRKTSQRYPMLRILWKPDASMPSITKGLRSFASTFHEPGSPPEQDSMSSMLGTLDLVTHTRPSVRILEICNQDDELTRRILEFLQVAPCLRQCGLYVRASIAHLDAPKMETLTLDTGRSMRKSLHNKTQQDEMFDVVLCPASSRSTSNIEIPPGLIHHHLARGAYVIFTGDQSLLQSLNTSGYHVSSTKGSDRASETFLIQQEMIGQLPSSETRPDVLIVYRDDRSPLEKFLVERLEHTLNKGVLSLPLRCIQHKKLASNLTVISTLEIEKPILCNMSHSEFDDFKLMMSRASVVVWVTGGGLMRCQKPELSLVRGFSRALMLEQPALKFITYDIEEPGIHGNLSANNILDCLTRLQCERSSDLEFLERKGVVHCSRFVPDEYMNQAFRVKQNHETCLTSLDDARFCRLSIQTVGQLDSLHFEQFPKCNELQPGHVRVAVQSIGLNAKDLYCLMGAIDTKHGTCSLECTGIVVQVGNNVASLKVGDKVIVMAPGHFATFEDVPEWACCKIGEDDDLNELATLPVVFSTAIHALHNRAHIQPGESVLIHSAAGGLGIAAIQVAKHAQADIFATVGTDAKKQFLIGTFGICSDHIFSSRDSSFLPELMERTSGRGVDIVLNSLTGDLLRDSWRACADFGRFVEVGKRDILDNGKLDMEMFSRNVTFTAFDLSNVFYSTDHAQHAIWNSLLCQTLRMYRDGIIKPVKPLKVFDCSEVTQAFRYFASRDRVGKVAVSMQKPLSKLEVVPLKYDTCLCSEKDYLMVGCLGGLGRSLSKWMLGRGARYFTFLSRNGVRGHSSAASELVADLRKAGAEVKVVQGDVAALPDVERAVQMISRPLGGVVQAAMGLKESLFPSMSHEAWFTAIRPKVMGTWNLHSAIKGHDTELDFFVMTSSISGSVGTATESNYCAANAFLDAFARFRRDQRLPATSIGLGMISEVGYLHEHPDIQALLLRKGIHPINEDELLQIFDIALTQQQQDLRSATGIQDHAAGHILTGLEATGLSDQRKQGFEGTSHVLDDPRAWMIASVLDDNANAPDKAGTLYGSVPEELAQAMEAGTASLRQAVYNVLIKKISNLLLQPADKLKPHTRLMEFGMDSMLAAEFRTFVYRATGVEVPFLTLLDKGTTLQDLADMLCEGIDRQQSG